MSTVSAVIGLLGETRKDGRLTRLGAAMLFLILAGAVTSVAIEVVREGEVETLARVEREWQAILEEEIRSVGLEFYATGRASVADFVQFTNLTRVDVRDVRSDLRAFLGFRLSSAGPSGAGLPVIFAAGRSDNRQVASADAVELFELEVKNGRLRGVSDASRRDSVTKICGVAAQLGWGSLGFKGLRRLRDLWAVAVTFEAPDKFDFPVELLGPAPPEFYFRAAVSAGGIRVRDCKP